MRNRETRMGNRAAKFISTLVASIIAGAPLAAVSQNAPTASSTANAAPDCLAAPKDAAPQGQHWYYRLDRTTKRKCWYLRAAGDKDSAKTAQATSDTPTADVPAPQQHPVQDARAEYLTPRSGAAPNTPNAPAQAAAATPVQQAADQAADGNAQQPAAAAPWPDVSTASAPPAPPPAPTAVAAAAQPSTKPSKSPSPVALATADNSTTDKPTGSLQTLMLVIGGALALAGILASLIYRFAGARVRLQSADRHGHWGDWEAQNQDGSRAPWLASKPADVRPPRPVDFDAARPQPTRHVTKLAAIGREIERIEARRQRASAPAAEPVETRSDKVEIKMVEKKFGTLAAAPQLAASEIGADRDDAPAGRDADAVDVDVITTMLEQLAKEGPRLSRPNLEADLANFARSLRGRSAARA
ncbi:hypothetical protein CVM73_23525 [Bradyrhizobium forestalis]|uniref:Uncharacterized protein n=1 Tax=Bradyrhizobium forestalis TaxID=1419263 RepID=A0A2M8R4U4_9BRAD|nr:hypothetical protein [Bradyrhizobium forestalis]PJG52835.1 hypothetical protein CVM73_23525 [Bradyrhizobium forestalis]